jgi:excisionase family DNA binding protein
MPAAQDEPTPQRPAALEPLQVTIHEAATLLRYHERTIRRLIARGDLRAVGRGRLRRVALADLRAWQERNRC